MSTLLKRLIAVAGAMALVAVIGLLVSGVAFAQTATPTEEAVPKPLFGPGVGLCGGGSWEAYDAVAKALGLTPTELFEQLHAGKTLSEIAEAQGVDLQAVQDAAAAAQLQAMKDAINQAVANGTMSQAEADWLLQGIEQGFIPGAHGFHFGGGRMMRGTDGGRWFGGKAPARTLPGTTGGTSL